MSLITKDIHEKFSRLVEASIKLNKASDLLSKEIKVLDSAIQKLNLGIMAEVETSNPNIKFGYGKVDKTWGIFIHELDTDTYWLFNDAPRPYRVTGTNYLIQLIEALVKVAANTTERVIKATDTARSYLEAMNNEKENNNANN